jgi:5-methylthioadenosine/S-adenosylhomocysteine deaminase
MTEQKSMSRRRFLAGTIVAGTTLTERLVAQNAPPGSGSSGRRIVLKGGIVLSMDPKAGDFERADVLIEGKKIVAVGPNLKAASAAVIDATDRIVMPGLIDTHHHQYQAVLRGLIADALLQEDYNRVINNPGALNAFYQPEDAYAGELLASVSQMRAGVTTAVDLSQISHSPAHSDACIAALKEAGRRTVFGFSAGQGPATQYPQDIVRLRSQYFSTDDQLLTLALHTGLDAKLWEVGRKAGVPIISHATSPVAAAQLEALGRAGLMGPDNEYIHCTHFPDTAWQLIRDTGGKLSIAPAIEMTEGHGMPAFQEALDHGIRPSLSTDVDVVMTTDLFTVMRSAFTLQRLLINERAFKGEKNLPARLTCQDVLEFATIEGARVAHLDHKVGSLTPGKEADILMLRTDDMNTFPLNNAPGAVVMLMDTSNVDTVFVAGKIMVWKGKLVGVDLGKLRRSAERARDGILARAGYRANLLNTCCPR